MEFESVPIRTRTAVPKPANWERLLPEQLRCPPREPPPPPDWPTTLGPPPYLIGYFRVSTRERQRNSEATQREAIQRRIARGDFKQHFLGCLIDRTSAKEVPFDERPVGRFLMRVLQEGDAIIVAAMDRLGRSVLDMMYTLKRLHDRKVEVYVVDPQGMPIDTVTPVGKMLVPVLAAFVEFGNDIRRNRIRTPWRF
jgi:DNA invertase Pin-like site-specific DNA recombinase